MLDFSGNRKALSTIWIIVIASAVLLVVIGAVLAYFFWPGNLRTEEMSFSDFTVVEVSNAFDVSIVQSTSYSITLTADKRIFDSIEVAQTENRLTIPARCISPVN